MKEKKGCFLVLLMMSLLKLRLWKETQQYLYHAQQTLTNHNKTNHHILYTRGKLFKAKITDSDSCHVCGLMQTLEHLFVECKHVQPLWNLFASWWNGSNLSILSLTSKKFTKTETFLPHVQSLPDSYSFLYLCYRSK